MAGRIQLVRHAEAVHNVDHDFSHIDPALTPLGSQQAENLGRTFPDSARVGLIITSPLRRTIQTTLLAFANVLDKRYYAQGSGHGVEGGAKLRTDPDLQERSALPVDTRSDRATLEIAFPGLDFSTLNSAWLSKEGFYAADDNAVNERARKVRGDVRKRIVELNGNERKDIVVVTHGVFMKFLSGDQAIDLPKAGWKSYIIEEDKGGGVFIPI